ncbi:hypothetical protein OMP43_07395 [Sphingomonas sp. CBMAI 2297]|uniref:hypothetical protein n=1 Tax=Sphingomonas sp. CBMAI 2297 TaxID=2991720 RepID=UPI002453D0D8|nr:hypothetical protein [Sphingomonas sp. CBMAI 2297]MDH4743838.1 hypothetical protein [Sphingomonas sp. CBMAI 2297]
MKSGRAIRAGLALLLHGAPALLSLVLARAAKPRQDCTLDDQAVGFICSDYGQFYWLAFGIFGLAMMLGLFAILRKRDTE